MIKKINFDEKKGMNIKTKIIIGVLIFLFCLYWVNKFFDNYRFNFNFIEIKFKPIIEKRIEKKTPAVKNPKSAHGGTKTSSITAGVKTSIITPTPIVKSFKKYLTSDASNLREKILIYLREKLQDENEIIAVDNIFKKESGYRPDAINEIGAGGLCQAYPHSKMNCQLSYEDWKCQVDWCLEYIKNRYSKPTEAWNFHLVNNWF